MAQPSPTDARCNAYASADRKALSRVAQMLGLALGRQRPGTCADSAVPPSIGRSAAIARKAGGQLAEALECRQLLSGVTKIGGTLTVTGNASGANNLVVQWTSDHVRLNIVDNKQITIKRFAGISSIVVVGGSGNDSIYVSPSLTIPVVIKGNGGHDKITAPAKATINGSVPVSGSTGGTTSGGTSSGGSGSGTPTGSGGVGSGIPVTPAIAVPGPMGSDVIGSVGWTPASGGGGNVAGAAGVTTVYGHNADPTAPQPVIDVLTQTVYAGTAIQFNGNQSKLGVGDPLAALYQWNFGDSSGKYNTLTGWNAAHVYNSPGTFTVTLSVTNEIGKTTSTTVSVNVLADNRRTVYVDSSSGNDRSSGSSPSDPIRSVYRAEQLSSGGNVRIFFHGGEQFLVTQPIGISVNYANIYLGSYGGGSATIMIDGPDAAIQGFNGRGNNLVVNNLIFDSIYKPNGNTANHISATAIFAGGTNTLVENCTFLNVDSAVNAEQAPTGVMLQDNRAPSPTGLRGYLFWGQGRDDVIIGNFDANSTREHCLRTEGVDRIFVGYNNFTNLNRSNVDKQDYSKGSVEIHKGTYAYVVGNTLTGGPLRAGPRGANTEPASTVTNWTVFDGNRVTGAPINILPGTHHFVIRNNIIDNEGLMDINITPSDGYGRNISDIRIFNNTGIDHNRIGQFVYSVGGLPNGSLTLGNNLFVAPNLTPGVGGAAPVNIKATNLNAFASIFNNVWANDGSRGSKWSHGGVNFIWPNFTFAGGYLTPSQWAAEPQVHRDAFSDVSLAGNMAATGAAASAAEALAGVFTDFYGKLRPQGSNWSAGAVQA